MGLALVVITSVVISGCASTNKTINSATASIQAVQAPDTQAPSLPPAPSVPDEPLFDPTLIDWNMDQAHNLDNNGNLPRVIELYRGLHTSGVKQVSHAEDMRNVLLFTQKYYGEMLQLTGTVTVIKNPNDYLSKLYGGKGAVITLKDKASGLYVMYIGYLNNVSVNDTITVTGYTPGTSIMGTYPFIVIIGDPISNASNTTNSIPAVVPQDDDISQIKNTLVKQNFSPSDVIKAKNDSNINVYAVVAQSIGSADGHNFKLFFFYGTQLVDAILATGKPAITESFNSIEVVSSDKGFFEATYANFLPNDPLAFPSGKPVIVDYAWGNETFKNFIASKDAPQ